ncbi:PcfJ domain-containing protein [Acutalibacter muris]|uniref:PcfJ domain-containing protein n=1 Tax=Acutalibacter muris TaxID=1796620 RepID=A0A1Z2XPB8_9FIRM|nr:PcfJ domain-containing protein [Acutalibacter muris]ANU53043.1 hypothetical protein A4V00_02830 [Hungateiclostridiaceae bacterium KB18]ASB40283.1 hypothetical protein ADH66_06190 [Acutalibacter muris]QQR29574.1 PcfJ domain-containing protein [Acutalibacter muris]
MLIKKELQNLPLSPAPDPTKKIPLTAGAKIHQLPRCGRILALDVYQQRKLLFRFFSDGKNCITWSEHPGKPGWTKKNLFQFDGIKYQAISIRPCSVKRITHILKANPSSLNVLHQTEECVGEFIERFHKQKKERARDAKCRLMEQHLDMFPAYPDDLDEFCENHVFHRSIVYLSKLEKGKRWGRCMHCGREFLLDRSVKPGSEGTCPKCSFPVRFRGERATKPIVEKAKICIPSRVDGQLLLRYTDVRRVISPDEREPEFDYSDFFLNIVVEKAGRQKAYAYWWRSYPYYWSGWSRLKNGSGCYSYTYVYTENLTEVFGEQYCHVDLQAGLRDLLRPIDFAGILRNLQNIPQAEYLFKLGLPGLAAGLSLKESGAASFSELTGVSKQYLPILRETQAGKGEINLLAESQKWVPFEVFRELCALNLDITGLTTMQSIMEYNSLGRVLRYLQGQKKIKKTYANLLGLYRDYLDMARNLGCNLKKKAILEPRDLKAQHDLLAEQLAAHKTEKENLLLPHAIENGLYEWAQEYASEDYCVVYPQTKNDFINEGRILHHCVGNASYYDRHVLGRSMVFFIRRASQPEKPFFTTEIDMDAGRIKQLYGFSDCSAPKEVRGFVEGFVRAAMRWRNAERMAG